MIIAISGKSGSGKDLVGAIIQHRLSNSTKNIYDWLNTHQNIRNAHSHIPIKKFAGKLKECVAIILGCTVSDLENSDFKSKYLGEDWIRYGRADGFFQGGSKGTIMNNTSCSKEEYEEELRVNWQTAYKLEHTPRSILQMLGTEVGRNIHPNFWINALFVDYKPKVCSGEVHCALKGKPEISCNLCPEYPNWIITDLRFPNELEAIKDNKGITIRINREACNHLDHISETDLDDANFDFTIDNNGTITELINKVTAICNNIVAIQNNTSIK